MNGTPDRNRIVGGISLALGDVEAMRMNESPARYAVVGNPIGHSKSPLIHSLFGQQTGEKIIYETLLAPKEGFQEAVRYFFLGGGAGLNVTVPFKQAAWAMSSQMFGDRRSKAVNTLFLVNGGEYAGANTDGIGIVRDIRDNLGIEIGGRRILLLGAGGAVRGVVPALEEESPASMTVWNRTAERASELARDFAGSLTAASMVELRGQQFDLIVNGTSSSLQGNLPEVDEAWLASGCCCYDMVYGDEDTAFVRWARDAGAAAAADGLGMLVEQAAESFRIWRGILPETDPVIRKLRATPRAGAR